ncbi:MAG: hypothetical protein IT185_06945 [Acidobacteria bacterium]|nr:hypothetical protein [Acidobacteriota bacterium]
MSTGFIPRAAWFAALVVVSSCSSSSPTTPPAPTPAPTLGAPTVLSPINDEQLSTLRPTFTVQNATSNQTGTRVYEFQISDRSDFSATSASTISGLFAVVTQTGVAEGAGGQTTFTPSVELQPTTRLYWRARVSQSGTTSAWSSTGMFRTKLVGFLRSGEVYDPLIHEETVGTRFGSTTFVPGVGIRLNTEASYVQYELPSTMTSGEFSVDVQGLAPNGPDHKLKIFSMMDGPGDLYLSNYQVSTMYRGVEGNPPMAIAFKAVFGGGTPIEPDFGQRSAGIRFLNPTTTYHWKATWGSEFRLLVREGGIAGNEIYQLGLPSNGRTYAPPRHFAFLGSTNGQSDLEPGTVPGATYRNVWIGNRPRPESLGSALTAIR